MLPQRRVSPVADAGCSCSAVGRFSSLGAPLKAPVFFTIFRACVLWLFPTVDQGRFLCVYLLFVSPHGTTGARSSLHSHCFRHSSHTRDSTSGLCGAPQLLATNYLESDDDVRKAACGANLTVLRRPGWCFADNRAAAALRECAHAGSNHNCRWGALDYGAGGGGAGAYGRAAGARGPSSSC